MVTGVIALLGCQLAGEFVVLPVPGPVVGMVFLFVVLQVRRPGPEAGVVRAADLLLRHLSLLFVPAGVGVVQYLPAIAAAALPIVAGLLVSWLAALLVTAAVASAALALTSCGRVRRSR
jgi:holin-like protein